MRANTHIHAAIRNIGDSQDTGTYFEGPLQQVILHLASHLGKISIARRIVIGIGRDVDSASQGINVAGAGRNKVTDQMRDSLTELLASVSFEGDDHPTHTESDHEHVPMGFVDRSEPASTDPLDDWNAESHG